jgi:signal transduction histidine kinase
VSGLLMILFQGFVFSFCFVWLTQPLPVRTNRLAAAVVLYLMFTLLYVPSTSSLLEAVLRYGKFILFYSVWGLVFLKIDKKYALFLAVFCTALMGIWYSLFQIFFLFFNLQNQNLLVYVTGLARIGSVMLFRQAIVLIDENRTISLPELFISTFPAMTSFLANLVIYSLLDDLEQRSRGDTLLIFFLVLFFGLSTLLILAGTEVYFKSARYAREVKAAEDQLNFQMQLMLKEKEKDEELKALHHDMRRHLNTLNRLSEIQQVRDYVDQLKAAAETTVYIETGNPVLDVILEDKRRLCQTKGIELKAGIRLDQAQFLSPMDLCTVFVNCLDNAVEAAEQCAESERVIEIAGGWIHENLVVRIQNPFVHTVKKQKGEWLSTKTDGGAHGYGLKNARKVVEKHGGTLTAEIQGKEFVVTWMIPKPQNA